MKVFRVFAEISATVYTDVVAKNATEAVDIAEDRHHEEWKTEEYDSQRLDRKPVPMRDATKEEIEVYKQSLVDSGV